MLRESEKPILGIKLTRLKLNFIPDRAVLFVSERRRATIFLQIEKLLSKLMRMAIILRGSVSVFFFSTTSSLVQDFATR